MVRPYGNRQCGSGKVVVLESGFNLVVQDMAFVLGNDTHIPENAVQMPVILIFQIASVTEAKNRDRYRIPAGVNVVRQVELRIQLTVL